MVWIILLLCLGLVGAAGYYQGPVRAAFAFFGLFFGTLLAGPLSPLTERLLILCGLHHPVWSVFAPQVLAFLIVLIIFKVGGQVVHQKIAVYFKYKVDDKTLYRWQRAYARLGLCVGLLNGAFYFILISLLIYSAGYFTTEAAGAEGGSGGVRFLTGTRSELHSLNLDRVLASYDMVSAKDYQAADMAALVLHNPLLLSRLGHYPPCLILAQQPQFKQLGNDKDLMQLVAAQGKPIEILDQPQVHTMLTNAATFAQVQNLIAPDLDDLQTYLTTGQSPKYDPQAILGVWDIDRAATVSSTVDQVKKKQPGITPSKLKAIQNELFPLSQGLSLTATPDHQVILKQPNPNNSEITVVATGTWKQVEDTYQVNLPGLLPETFEVEFVEGNRLLMPKTVQDNTYVLAFDKEL
ncbi:MAG TPA: hypothetical protein VGO59_08630 [Verrucomicrobiae bacterium]|jgi:hypothetical protein